MTSATASPALQSPEWETACYGADGEYELGPGAVVAEKYRVKAVLGRGGFAVVYDAEHLALARPVALKVLHRSEQTPHQLVERFAREVRISALVRHPNVLEVHDAGVLPDGSPFLVMEKISGLTLYERLCMEQKLGVEETIALFGQLLDALTALEERGIVHRDIKPENLMLTRSPEGEVRLKLVDFGIALVRDERLEPRLTMQGALVGTPHYMAPEQLRCELVDTRVDLYATGVVMYQALTGKLPYEGTTLSALTSSVLYGKAAAVSELCPDCPPGLALVVERALARDPAERFAHASEMREMLERCREPRLSQLDRPSHWHRAVRRLSRPRELALGLALLSVGVFAPDQTTFASALRSAFPSAFSAAETPGGAASARREPKRVNPTSHEPASRAEPAALTAALAEPEAQLAASAAPSSSLQVHAGARVRSDEEGSGHADLRKARALVRRGLTLYLHGELDAAYAVYRRATLLSPAEAAAFRGLGLCASRLGRNSEARKAFGRYVELSPDAPDVRLIRARLNALLAER